MKTNVKNILDKINDLSTQLYQCLVKEHDALSTDKIEKLIPLSEQKQALITQLDELDKQRLSLSEKKDFILFLKSIDARLVSDWEATKKSVKKCKQQNEINGLFLQRKNIIAKETLELFTGRKPDADTTYGADGQTNKSNSLVTNVKA
jgi:flagellar biosynthesis/type III secretory pathway chaperone